MASLKKLISKLLRDLAEKINSDNCELNEEQAMEIMSVISHEAMSKDQACSYLNISKSKFDKLVRQRLLPKGRKRRGFKELVYYKDELDRYINNKGN